MGLPSSEVITDSIRHTGTQAQQTPYSHVPIYAFSLPMVNIACSLVKDLRVQLWLYLALVPS